MDDARIRKLCSDVTLQSQKEGFFNQWADTIEELMQAEDWQKFALLTSDIERIQNIWRYDFVHSLQIQSFFTPKSQTVSEEKRQEGNKAFQSNEYKKAVQLYSQAVIRAPSTGSDLSLSLANRSASLFHLKNYELCLQDISLALLQGYPAKLKYKVLDRRGQCLSKMGRIEEAKKAFEDALKAVEDSDLEEGKRKSWIKEVKKNIEKVSNSDEKIESENVEEVYKEDIFKGYSKIFPTASSSIDLKYSSETGRYMSASEDIPALKVLVRERPFSSVLMQEKRGAFCEHCFKKLLAPIPCNTCSGVAFCSSECLSLALQTYHKWECPYLNLFKASGMSLNCFLSLRVITEKGLKYFDKIQTGGAKSDEIPSPESPHDPDDYKNFYSLVGLEEQRETNEFFRRTLMAVFLLKVLQHAEFFETRSRGENIGVEELHIGSLLLRHLQVIQFNAHEVSGISYEGHKSFKACKSVYLGLAVYPTVSFFNHSCFPAVGRYFNGKEMTIVNLRPLKKGEMIAENYGPIFTHSTLAERQKKLLSRYWFSCKCEACNSNWPKYDRMPNTLTLLNNKEANKDLNQQRQDKNKRNKKNKNKTQNQDKKQDEEQDVSVSQIDFKTLAYKDFELGKTLMDEFKREEAISSYKKWVEAMADKVQLPFKDFHLALEALRLLVGARGTSYINTK